MTITRMGHVALQVKDMDKALEFYENVLGLKARWSKDKDWANMQIGRDDLSLVRAEGARHPPHIGFRVPDVAALEDLHKRLHKMGVAVEAITTHRDKSVSFYFKDPDGHDLEALWDPALP